MNNDLFSGYTALRPEISVSFTYTNGYEDRYGLFWGGVITRIVGARDYILQALLFAIAVTGFGIAIGVAIRIGVSL